MTVGEAIRNINELKKDVKMHTLPHIAEIINEALDIAIKALEQEDVLEKIRAEIENHCGLVKRNHCRYCSYCNCVMGVREILKVIDKYRAESEDKGQ